MSYGTAYALRVPTQQIDAALAVGCEVERTWSTGDKTNVEETLGLGWVFGAWVDEELRWLRDRNLDEATFEERIDLIARLGVAVYPSEELTTAKVTCRLGGGG